MNKKETKREMRRKGKAKNEDVDGGVPVSTQASTADQKKAGCAKLQPPTPQDSLSPCILLHSPSLHAVVIGGRTAMPVMSGCLAVERAPTVRLPHKNQKHRFPCGLTLRHVSGGGCRWCSPDTSNIACRPRLHLL